MPDKNYNVDDILQEIRRKQGGASRDVSAPKPKKQAPRASLPEEDEDVVEYQPRRREASTEAHRTRSVREDWPEEEDEPEYQPPRRKSARRETPPEERRTRSVREDWPEEEDEPEYQPPRRKSARRETPPPEERRTRSVREDWPEEEDEPEYQPPRRKPTRRETPPEERRTRPVREDWSEEDDELEYQSPRRRATRKEAPQPEERRRAIAQAAWPEEEEGYRPPRPRPSRREKPDLRAYGELEEIGEIRGLTDSSEPEPPKEYFPPVKLDLPEEPTAPTPTLDDLWQAADTTPPRRERPPRRSSSGAPSARPLWEEDEPPRHAQSASRAASAAPSARPLWEEDTSAPQPSRREEAPPSRRPAASEGKRNPIRPLWKEEGQPEIGGEQDAPRGLPGGKSDTERFEDQILKTTARAARADTEDSQGRSALLGFGESPQESQPKNPIAFGAEGGEDRPRRRQSRASREEPVDEESRSHHREEDPRAARGRILAQLHGMKTGLTIRLAVNLLCALGVIYLMLAPGQELPIPDYFYENPTHLLWLEVGLVAFSALVSGNTVGGGIISLFCLRPNNDSYSAIGVFACLVQGSYMALRPEMMEHYSANLYLPMAVLLLLFNTIGKMILRGRIAASYRLIGKEGAKHTAAVIEDAALADKLGRDVIDGEPEIAYFTRASGISAFMDQAFSESKAEDVSKIIAPMTAAAAFVMALISYPFHHDVFTSACVFTAALCITAPIAGVIAANLPITLTNRRLDRWGATLCGYSAVNQFAEVNGILLRGYDLFPPESVTLHAIKPFNRTPMDEVILDIASVLSRCGSTLTQIFLEMVPDKNLLREAESFVCEDGKGVSAWVNGRRVLIGNRELMKSYGVSIPPMEYEEQYGQGKQLLYISNSGQAAGVCVLSYKGDKQMRRALELLADRDIAVCVYTTDPNVTEARISQIYNFPKELVKVMPAALHREMDKYLDPKAKTRAGMIHNGSPSSYVRGVAAARSCDAALTIETALILLSVVVGFALVTFFAFTGGMPALTWITLAVYQLFWAIVQILVALLKG